jgi:STE24 endopeptidase
VRDWAQRIGRYAFLRDALYGVVYALGTWLLSLPLTIYQGYMREHAYGMATQQFGSWFVDQLIGLIISMLVIALTVGVLYAAIRRAGERWWLWATGGTAVFLVLQFLVSPIWIDPLFNTYKPLPDGPVKTAVLGMARADDVPVNDVYWFDASRQTTRVSANVSGIFGSAAVRLNDNLLFHSSLPEIRAVTGHEIGHYVLHHIYIAILETTAMYMLGFLFAQWAMNKLLRRYSQRFGLHGISDVASLPLLVAVFSVYSFFTTPVNNTLTRVQEIEADTFGLNLAREPLGEAEVDLKLTEYRKPDPGPVEEFIFFDHPSTRFRIHAAMQWRENMESR